MKQYFKKKILHIFFILILLTVSLSFFTKNKNKVIATSVVSDTLSETLAKDLKELWSNYSCGYFISPHEEYDYFSLACEGTFSSNERDIFLNQLFKRGLYVQKETYRTEKGGGFYLYKLGKTNGDFIQRPLFVKLYFRPLAITRFKKEKSAFSFDFSIALFVTGIANEKQLLQWQNLGIPLHYSLNPAVSKLEDLVHNIKNYGQSLWIDFAYESKSNSNRNFQVTLKKGYSREELESYLSSVLKKIQNPDGIICGRGNSFSQNTYAVRNWIQVIKNQQVPMLLDVDSQTKISYATAEILEQKAYLLNMFSEGSTIEKDWRLILQEVKKNKADNLVVWEVKADDEKVYLFLSQLIKDLSLQQDSISFIHLENQN